MAQVAVKDSKTDLSNNYFFHARDLPKKFSPDDIISIPRNELLTEDWFTLDEVDEILQISADAKKGIGIDGPISMDEFIQELKDIRDGSKKI